MRRLSLTSAAALAPLALLLGCVGEPGGERARSTEDLTGVRFLGDTGADAGFARAAEPREFAFPRDHGPHPRFRSEWWYLTGNLFDAERRHFGFELTFFRFALAAESDEAVSRNAAPTIWMANFAITDPAAGEFHAAERLARADSTLAFARTSPLEVRVEDWSLVGTAPDVVMLRAEDAGYSLELAVEGIGDIVLQGDRGLDRKGPEPGNASYYYSAPRVRARGRLGTPGSSPRRVEGSAWLDREWGTSALSPGIVGWDWFAIQLNDGRDLMYYRLRDGDGDASEFSGGTIRTAEGGVVSLSSADVETEVTGQWLSPMTGIAYPVRWRLAIPAQRIELDVTPVIPNQELALTVRYWEGAVTVAGTADGRPVRGRGYLELAGYR